MSDEKKMADALHTLEANKEDFKNWRMGVADAQAAGDPLPAPPPSIAGAVSTVGNVLGGVALGVGSTAADVVGGVGGIANAAHNEVNDFFAKLRARLGV